MIRGFVWVLLVALVWQASPTLINPERVSTLLFPPDKDTQFSYFADQSPTLSYSEEHILVWTKNSSGTYVNMASTTHLESGLLTTAKFLDLVIDEQCKQPATHIEVEPLPMDNFVVNWQLQHPDLANSTVFCVWILHWDQAARKFTLNRIFKDVRETSRYTPLPHLRVVETDIVPKNLRPMNGNVTVPGCQPLVWWTVTGISEFVVCPRYLPGGIVSYIPYPGHCFYYKTPWSDDRVIMSAVRIDQNGLIGAVDEGKTFSLYRFDTSQCSLHDAIEDPTHHSFYRNFNDNPPFGLTCTRCTLECSGKFGGTNPSGGDGVEPPTLLVPPSGNRLISYFCKNTTIVEAEPFPDWSDQKPTSAQVSTCQFAFFDVADISASANPPSTKRSMKSSSPPPTAVPTGTPQTNSSSCGRDLDWIKAVSLPNPIVMELAANHTVRMSYNADLIYATHFTRDGISAITILDISNGGGFSQGSLPYKFNSSYVLNSFSDDADYENAYLYTIGYIYDYRSATTIPGIFKFDVRPLSTPTLLSQLYLKSSNGGAYSSNYMVPLPHISGVSIVTAPREVLVNQVQSSSLTLNSATLWYQYTSSNLLDVNVIRPIVSADSKHLAVFSQTIGMRFANSTLSVYIMDITYVPESNGTEPITPDPHPVDHNQPTHQFQEDDWFTQSISPTLEELPGQGGNLTMKNVSLSVRCRLWISETPFMPDSPIGATFIPNSDLFIVAFTSGNVSSVGVSHISVFDLSTCTGQQDWGQDEPVPIEDSLHIKPLSRFDSSIVWDAMPFTNNENHPTIESGDSEGVRFWEIPNFVWPDNSITFWMLNQSTRIFYSNDPSFEFTDNYLVQYHFNAATLQITEVGKTLLDHNCSPIGSQAMPNTIVYQQLNNTILTASMNIWTLCQYFNNTGLVYYRILSLKLSATFSEDLPHPHEFLEERRNYQDYWTDGRRVSLDGPRIYVGESSLLTEDIDDEFLYQGNNEEISRRNNMELESNGTTENAWKIVWNVTELLNASIARESGHDPVEVVNFYIASDQGRAYFGNREDSNIIAISKDIVPVSSGQTLFNNAQLINSLLAWSDFPGFAFMGDIQWIWVLSECAGGTKLASTGYCSKCSPGSFGLGCSPCAPGYLCNNFGLLVPDLLCPLGMYCSGGVSTLGFGNQPQPCRAGTYCPGGVASPEIGKTNSARKCSSGFYCGLASPVSTMNQCPEHSTSVEGAPSVDFCYCALDYFGQNGNCTQLLDHGISVQREGDPIVTTMQYPPGYYPTAMHSVNGVTLFEQCYLNRAACNPTGSTNCYYECDYPLNGSPHQPDHGTPPGHKRSDGGHGGDGSPPRCRIRCDEHTLCEVGYKGRLCSQCADGYYERSHICSGCSDASTKSTTPWIIIAALLVVGLLALVVIGQTFIALIIELLSMVLLNAIGLVPVWVLDVLLIFVLVYFINRGKRYTSLIKIQEDRLSKKRMRRRAARQAERRAAARKKGLVSHQKAPSSYNPTVTATVQLNYESHKDLHGVKLEPEDEDGGGLGGAADLAIYTDDNSDISAADFSDLESDDEDSTGEDEFEEFTRDAPSVDALKKRFQEVGKEDTWTHRLEILKEAAEHPQSSLLESRTSRRLSSTIVPLDPTPGQQQLMIPSESATSLDLPSLDTIQAESTVSPSIPLHSSSFGEEMITLDGTKIVTSPSLPSVVRDKRASAPPVVTTSSNQFSLSRDHIAGSTPTLEYTITTIQPTLTVSDSGDPSPHHSHGTGDHHGGGEHEHEPEYISEGLIKSFLFYLQTSEALEEGLFKYTELLANLQQISPFHQVALLDCIEPTIFSYASRFIMYTALIPVFSVVLLLMYFAGLLHMRWTRYRKLRALRQDTQSHQAVGVFQLAWAGEENDLASLRTGFTKKEIEKLDSKRRRLRYRWARIWLFFVSVFYFELTEGILKVFRCELDHSNGLRYMESQPWLVCDPKIYPYSFLLPLAIIGVIVYVIGIPVFLFYLLWHHRHRLHNPKVMSWLGLLYEEYRPELWWFEMTMIARRVVIALVLALVPVDSEFGPILITSTLLAAMFINLWFRAFVSDAENSVDLLAMCTILITYLAGTIQKLNGAVKKSHTGGPELPTPSSYTSEWTKLPTLEYFLFALNLIMFLVYLLALLRPRLLSVYHWIINKYDEWKQKRAEKAKENEALTIQPNPSTTNPRHTQRHYQHDFPTAQSDDEFIEYTDHDSLLGRSSKRKRPNDHHRTL